MNGSFGAKALAILLVGPWAGLPGFVPNAGAVAPRLALPCTLVWDRSPDPDVAGYALYYTRSGSSATNRLDVRSGTSATLYDLMASSNYVFFAVSYDSIGTESLPSNVVLYRPLALSPLQITNLPGGAIRLGCRAATGSVCRIECTQSLPPTNWQTLGIAVADSNGTVVVIDATTNRPTARYYRAVLP